MNVDAFSKTNQAASSKMICHTVKMIIKGMFYICSICGKDILVRIGLGCIDRCSENLIPNKDIFKICYISSTIPYIDYYTLRSISIC